MSSSSSNYKDLCILPLAKSRFEPHEDRIYVSGDGYLGYKLVGHGEAYDDCGDILPLKTVGCLETGKHKGSTLDRGKNPEIVIKIAERDCMRAECPKHYHSWANKQADSMNHRIGEYSRLRDGSMPIHLTISVPKKDWYLKYDVLKRKAQLYALESGFRGGAVIFHPYRQEKLSKRWYYSPHFHLLGFGWIEGTENIEARTGWIVKNLGARKSVRATAFYQLSHCGIVEGKHVVTWFGDLSYNRFNCPNGIPDKAKCPICGGDLLPVKYIGDEEDFYEGVKSGLKYNYYKEDWIYVFAVKRY